MDEPLGANDGPGDDIQSMQQAWINETNAPEILPYEQDLVNGLTRRLEDQMEMIEAMPMTPEQQLLRELYSMEVDRIKYILRAYLRARLYKLEGLVMHQLSTAELRTRLSKNELDFARRYRQAFEKHMHQSFLSSLPEKQQRLDEVNKLGNMVPEPNLDTFVFVRIRETLGNVSLEEGADNTVELVRGDVYMMRYRIVQPFLLAKRVELI